MLRRIPIVILLMLGLILPAATPARAQATPPDGLLMQSASWPDDRLCPGGTLVFSLSFFDLSDPAVDAYTASVSLPIPANSSYASHSGSGITYDPRGNSIGWEFPVDPSQPSLEPPTAVISLTIDSAATDGTLIESVATGLLARTVEVKAAATATVHCDPTSEPARDPEEFPAPGPEEQITPPQESAAQVTAANVEESTTSEESVLADPELGDELPPYYLAYDLFLPNVASGANTDIAASSSDIGGLPIGNGPVCDYVFPWASRHGMSEAVYQADATKWDTANYRPIAVSANGNGSNTRFASLWIKDNKYGKNWSLKHNLTTAQYAQQVTTFKGQGLRPVVVDLYGTTSDPRYAAIWVKESQPFQNEQALNTANMQTKIDEHAAAGYRPVWVSGLGSSANNSPVFAGLWVRDSYTGTMRIGLTSTDIGTEGVARSMVDQGYRMVHLSGYETQDGTRYAAVWTKGGDCDNARWEAFRDWTSTQYQVKASVQRKVSSVKTLAAEAITLDAGDLSGSFRIARVAIKHNFGTGKDGPLATINPGAGVTFKNGDILTLQVAPGNLVTLNERDYGNIMLRSPKYADAAGQPFQMNDYQYRIVLQYQSIPNKWVELQRNEISPDYYWPTSIDEFSAGDKRLYNSVWSAGKVERTWRIAGTPQGGDTLDQFDLAMQTFMQRRNIPNGQLAMTFNGRLVLARSYTWEPASLPASQPDDLFRLASVSKPLTAIGVLKLVQQRKLGLDTRLVDIPGFDAVLKSENWLDQRIRDVTVRHLLHHEGGWDRDDGVGDYMMMDWSICNEAQNVLLATDRTEILGYARAKMLDFAPGTAHNYSNFGYMLLGMVIETVSSQSYADFIQDNVLKPAGASDTQQGGNYAGADNEVRYYTPNNRMASNVTGIQIFNPPAAYNPCNYQHAFITPASYGNFNIPAMDAHGAWISSAVELAKVMRSVDNGTLLDADLRSQMWSRPDGRSRRVTAYDKSTGKYNDRTIRARTIGDSAFFPIDETGDILILGRGLSKFSKISFDVTNGGKGYTLKLIYPTKSGGWKFLAAKEDGLVDGTDGFTQDGDITFTAPKDWAPVVMGTVDSKPRYYLMAFSTSNPSKIAGFDVAYPSGETNYGLGWTAGNPSTSTLAYKNRIGTLAVGGQIVGEQSKAAATIVSVTPSSTSSGVLTIGPITGGPFYPGEKLLFANLVVATAVDRDWAVAVNADHGGLLWGTRASIQHRSDGVNWAILFNQENAYNPYWYLPGEGSINSAIWTLADDFTTNNKWPAFDLFPQYP